MPRRHVLSLCAPDAKRALATHLEFRFHLHDDKLTRQHHDHHHGPDTLSVYISDARNRSPCLRNPTAVSGLPNFPHCAFCVPASNVTFHDNYQFPGL